MWVGLGSVFSFVVGCMGCCPLCFLGVVLSVFFSVPLGLGLVFSLAVAFCLLEINSYLSKKKKKSPLTHLKDSNHGRIRTHPFYSR